MRIQRRRYKGWEMPENTLYVGRPSKWGNPYNTVLAFSEWLDGYYLIEFSQQRHWILCHLWEIAQYKKIACWCPVIDRNVKYFPCHGDILLAKAYNISLDEVKQRNVDYYYGRTNNE